MNHYTPPIPVNAVLFDLDGTLVDTAPDLANALNKLLVENDRAPLPYSKIRNTVSQGGAALTRLGFPDIKNDSAFEQLRQSLLKMYAETLCVETVLFENMAELLDVIEQKNLPWGIVTNKPAWLSEPLVRELHLIERATCIVSGDSVSKRKPHPDPLLHACKLMGVAPECSLYVGDDPRDIYAGNAAGMYTCLAAYGYIDSDQDVDLWGADFIIESPHELVNHITLTKHINDVGT